MLTVGLTGNVAAGKSAVADHFARWGATVIRADALVREVQQPGTPVFDAIVARFGPAIVRADGALDRDALRRTVLADPGARADLEAIVHPAVRRLRDARDAAAQARGDLLVVHEIPLLFEVLDPASFDVIVVVDADAATRRARLTTLRGLAAGEADRLVAAQFPAAAKRARADYVIENDGSLRDLEDAARAVWEALRARAGKDVDRP